MGNYNPSNGPVDATRGRPRLTREEILYRFGGIAGSGRHRNRKCPAHEDINPSLSITEKNGKILLYCHAGCSPQDICAAVGLELSDLFLDPPSNSGRQQKSIVAEYNYTDKDGELLFQVVRYEPKDFRQRRPDGSGGWIYNLQGVHRPLYRLPELLASDLQAPVFIAEGEKDVERLAAIGLVSTTNPGGAQKWREQYNDILRERHVIILPDNDGPGWEHAERIAQSLQGIAASLRVVQLPNLPEKADISDWLDAGHTVDELKAIVSKTPEWREQASSADNKETMEEKPLAIIRASSVTPRKVDWLWYPYIPLNYVTLFSGEEGVGKSWVFCAIASGITNGFLPLAEKFEPQNVLIFSAEDAAEDALVPRLIKCKANLERVFIVNERFTFDGKGLLRFEHYIAETNPAWVIVDPLFSYSDLRLDLNRPHHARNVAGKFEIVAKKYGIALSYLIHFNKSKGGGDARAAISSSQEFSNAARSIVLIGKDPKDDSRRALIHKKHNYSPKGKAIGYRITGDKDTANFYWLGESTLNEREIVDHAGTPEEYAEQSEAIAFLREALRCGERDSQEVEKEANDQFGLTKKQLRTARYKIGIKLRPEGFGKNKKSYWSLPSIEATAEPTADKNVPEGSPASINAQNQEKGHLCGNGDNKTTYNNNLSIDAPFDNCGHIWPNGGREKAFINDKSKDAQRQDANSENAEGHFRINPSEPSAYDDNSIKDALTFMYGPLQIEVPNTEDSFSNFDSLSVRTAEDRVSHLFSRALKEADPEQSEQMIFEFRERVALMSGENSISKDQAAQIIQAAKRDCLEQWWG